MDLLRLGEHCGDAEVAAVLERDGRGWIGNILTVAPALLGDGHDASSLPLPCDVAAEFAGCVLREVGRGAQHISVVADGQHQSGKTAFLRLVLHSIRERCAPSCPEEKLLHKRLRNVAQLLKFFTETADGSTACLSALTLQLRPSPAGRGLALCGARLRLAAFCADLQGIKPFREHADQEEADGCLKRLGVSDADRRMLWKALGALRHLATDTGPSLPVDEVCASLGLDEFAVMEGRIPIDTSAALQQAVYCSVLQKVAEWATESLSCRGGVAPTEVTVIDPPSSPCHLHDAVGRMLKSHFVSTVFEKEVFEALADGVRCPKIQPPCQLPDTQDAPNLLLHTPRCLAGWESAHPLLGSLTLPTAHLYDIMQGFSGACFYVKCLRGGKLPQDVSLLEIPRIVRRLATLLPARMPVDAFQARYGRHTLECMQRSPLPGEWHVGKAKVWMSKRTLSSIERGYLMLMGSVAVAGAIASCAVEQMAETRSETVSPTNTEIPADPYDDMDEGGLVPPAPSGASPSVLSQVQQTSDAAFTRDQRGGYAEWNAFHRRASATEVFEQARAAFQRRQAVSKALRNKENDFAQKKAKYTAGRDRHVASPVCDKNGQPSGSSDTPCSSSRMIVPSIVALQERRNHRF